MTASQQPTGHDKAVEWMSERLIEEGAGVGGGFHGWRCEYPDIYGECDCVAESARDILAALRAALAAGDTVVAEALGGRVQVVTTSYSVGHGIDKQPTHHHDSKRRFITEWVEA